MKHHRLHSCAQRARMLGAMRRRRGLSSIDVLIVIATVALLAVLFLPRLARTKARTKRMSCTSQRKQVGLAYRLFSNDHGDKFPYAVSNELGGTLQFENSPQVFRHF